MWLNHPGSRTCTSTDSWQRHDSKNSCNDWRKMAALVWHVPRAENGSYHVTYYWQTNPLTCWSRPYCRIPRMSDYFHWLCRPYILSHSWLSVKWQQKPEHNMWTVFNILFAKRKSHCCDIHSKNIISLKSWTILQDFIMTYCVNPSGSLLVSLCIVTHCDQ